MGVRVSQWARQVATLAMLALVLPALAAVRGDAASSPGRPNVVLILTDDLDARSLEATRDQFPAIAGLRDQGTAFSNFVITMPLCCPSRASILRGQYAHNTGVWDHTNGPDGGWEGYQGHGNEQDNVATRLHEAGYRTGLFGKYLNGYENTTHVPPAGTSGSPRPATTSTTTTT